MLSHALLIQGSKLKALSLMVMSLKKGAIVDTTIIPMGNISLTIKSQDIQLLKRSVVEVM